MIILPLGMCFFYMNLISKIMYLQTLDRREFDYLYNPM